MTWSALSAKADAAKNAANAVDVRVNQVVACARAGMLYAPESPGANAEGCLVSKLDPTYVTKMDALNSQVNSINTCAASGSLYDRNTHSCSQVKMPDPASLKVESHHEFLCRRGGNHTVVSNCPGNQRLMGCGGGPGDQSESHEYWVLMPDFANNRCVGYVGNPACYDSGWSRTMVSAICYQP
ncbi:hypothetical protein ACSV5K_10290 [Agrobacterium pusense]|uniref:hypothetical protein n=1 Tax=Agrobacterium pusense TaxID=648995 RepID=UPI003FD64DD1